MKQQIKKMSLLAILLSMFLSISNIINAAENSHPYRTACGMSGDTYGPVNTGGEVTGYREYPGANVNFNPPGNIHMFRGSKLHKARVQNYCHQLCNSAQHYQACFHHCLRSIKFGEENNY